MTILQSVIRNNETNCKTILSDDAERAAVARACSSNNAVVRTGALQLMSEISAASALVRAVCVQFMLGSIAFYFHIFVAAYCGEVCRHHLREQLPAVRRKAPICCKKRNTPGKCTVSVSDGH